MTKILIRPATTQDIDSIVALCNQAQKHHITLLNGFYKETDGTFDRKHITNAIDNQKFIVLVATHNDTVVGFLLASFEEKPWLEHAKIFNVDNLAVDESMRNQGIGRALMQKLYEFAKKQGIEQISLSVFCKNTDAIDFYKNLGFSPISYRMYKDIAPE